MRKTRRKGDATSGEKKEGSMDAWKVENRLQGRKEGRTEDSEKWQKVRKRKERRSKRWDNKDDKENKNGQIK